MRAALLPILLVLLAAAPAARAQQRFEAEDATRTGNAAIATTRANFSGDGYVTGLSQHGDSLHFDLGLEAGDFFQLRLAVAASARFAQYELLLDGAPLASGTVNVVGTFRESLVVEQRLAAGAHRLTVRGTFDVDYLVLEKARYERPAPPRPVLADPDATPAARALFAFLLDTYGTHVLAGQQDIYQGTRRTAEIDYVRSVTGKVPAIGAFDLIEYSPSRRAHGSDPAGWAEHWIGWAGQDGIVTLMWHWNAPRDLLNTAEQPWWRGFYTEATTFDVAAALADTTGEAYGLLLRDIDAIAAELRKFADADVPVLWRPLHEAYGRWFWWGAQGPEPYVALWRLLYRRLVHHHGLHHLIWVHTHRPTDADQADWYPGDAYVDVVGVDLYAQNPDALFRDEWRLLQEQFGGNKLAALTETGTLPDLTRSVDYGATWSYFAIWNGSFVRDLDPAYLRAIYTSDAVLTRDELPDWRTFTLPTRTEPVAAVSQPGRLTLYPNPTASAARVEAMLPEPAEVTVEVFDVTGRRVQHAALGYHAAGPLATTLDVGGPSGVYLVRLTAGPLVLHQKLVLTR